MKVGLAGIILETNSFSPLRSDAQYFLKNGFLLHGESVLTYHDDSIRNEISGFLNICKLHDTNVFASWAGWAVPYGPMPYDTYVEIKSGIIKDFKENLDSLDGIYLALHGSMVVESMPDPEGDLLASVRSLIGNKLLVTTLDYHANVTEMMAQNASLIVGYNSYPHDNLFETGQRAGTLFHKYVGKRTSFATIFAKLPLITPLERMTVSDNPPMKHLIARANQISSIDGICVASVFGVQPWNDVPELGSSVVVTAELSQMNEGHKYCFELASAFWRKRAYYKSIQLLSIDQALRVASDSEEPTVLLNEPSDNVGSGATGDSSNILRYLLDHGIMVPTILTICDPEAVNKCIAAGIGKKITVHVGGTHNPEDPGCTVSGIIHSIHDGVYRYRGPVQTGVRTSMGSTIVLEFNSQMYLQVTETPPYTIDPEHYRCVGLFPERMKLVGIKSQGSYKAAYKDIPHKMLLIDSPGISSSNLDRIRYTMVDKKKIYPFNEQARFHQKTMKTYINHNEEIV